MELETSHVFFPFRPWAPGQKQGFALVVTLSLMILLTIIAVGLLTLSSISLRSSTAQSAQATARANARMALMLAIGELQKQAGPDQRVTAEAAILGRNSTSVAQPRWTGVWNSSNSNRTPASATSQPKWLVSGSDSIPNPDPLNPPSNLFTIAKELNQTTGVAVPRQTIAGNAGSNNPGAFAYWVAGEWLWSTRPRTELATLLEILYCLCR
jgi:Tfp pilus assembly protein PilX